MREREKVTEDNKTVRIACEGSTTVELAELVPLQGELKTLTEEAYEKLKRSILKYGVSFPLFYWENGGVKYCLDGHQRHRVLRTMLREGYEIPPLPADPVEAADEREAKEKILLLSSQYGKVDPDSLYQFASEGGLDFAELGGILEIPDVDWEKFRSGYLEEAQPPEGFKSYGEDIETAYQCPKCGYEWSGKPK